MFIYQVIEEVFTSEEDEDYISYGIKGFYVTYGVYREIIKVSDISLNKEDVIQLADMCRRYQLYPVHLMDVIEDFIG